MMPPNERRNFVHKRIIGAISGLTTGGPLGALSGFARGGGGGRTPPQCPPGFTTTPSGQCVPLPTGAPAPGVIAGFQRLLPGGQTGMIDFGEAVMGRYGAGLQPGIRMTDNRVCPRGTVLGNDGLCYNKRDLKNSEREWPAGRRPLLTGGEMRCISIAAGAAKKLATKTKQLQSLGLLKKPVRRRAASLAPGHHAHLEHN